MKILFVSLGCDKNLSDSEMMLGLLQKEGFEFTDDETEAEVIVVNTCCFIGDAKEESINTLISMGELKKTAKLKVLVAAGCLAERYTKEIREEIKEVDALIGTTSIDKIVEAVKKALEGKKEDFKTSIHAPAFATTDRVLTTGGHFAYLKIAEGCDKHCTYCIIPKVRGNYRSIPMEVLLEEAKSLVEKGVKELILVAQETSLYGTDLYGQKTLPKLLEELSKIEDLKWIRILYCYPEEVTDEIIDAIANNEKVVHYLDIPIQHAADPVLKRMGRHTTKQELIDKIKLLRARIPDICLRTTLISGFPGETEEDFEELYRFVNEMEFDRLGVFTYSAEEDTAAAIMDGQIPEEVKQSRRDELMELQQAVTFDKAADLVGVELEAIVEGYIPDEGTYVARTYRDAPSVDGFIFFNSGATFVTGDFVKLRVTDTHEYDLIGELI